MLKALAIANATELQSFEDKYQDHQIQLLPFHNFQTPTPRH
jgi:hypothetical protein